MDDPAAEISRASAVEGPAIELGRGVLDGALPAPEARAQELGVPWTPTAFPAEYLGGEASSATSSPHARATASTRR